jgi:energy-converting hydrogenase Eha subunit F
MLCDNRLEYETLIKNIKSRNKFINCINYLSVAFLFLGLVLLIAFVTSNINNVSKTKPDTVPQEQKGRTIPLPAPVPQSPSSLPSTKPTNPTTNK